MPENATEAALGRICIAFQNLENELLLLVARLADRQEVEVGLIMMCGRPFKQLTFVAQALLEFRTAKKDLKDEFTTILNQSRELNDQRNRYIHSLYEVSEIASETIYERVKTECRGGKLDRKYENVGSSTLDKLQRSLSEAVAKVEEFSRKLREIGLIAQYEAE